VKDGSFLKKAFYIQVACGATEEQLQDIGYFSLIQVSLGGFGCLAFIVVIKTDYKNRAKVEKLIYRSYALYAKDYTVEIALSREQTEYFKRDTYSNHKDRSIAEVYQETLMSQLQTMLRMLYIKKFKPEGEEKHKAKSLFEIALCTFSFQNGDLIELLDERGDKIIENDAEKIIAVN